MLRARKMPPQDRRRPKDAEYDAVNAWLEAALGQADRAGPADPGRVTIRRLNRAEYANTVRDLLGVEFNAAADFPSDDVGYGFDNIGDVLALPPLLMEKYLAAAEQIAAKAIVEDKPGDMEQVLRRLATRAYRRPISDQELARLMKLAATARAQGDKFEAGMRLRAASDPYLAAFPLPRGTRPGTEWRQADPSRSNEYELASRLSYFLWSSMPDDELFDLAARGKLRENLDRQVRRMLSDPKSKALVENFAGQWLQLRNLDLAAPDKSQFPAFDDDLRRAMRTESEMFFAAIVREDRSVLELLDADFTFVNARLRGTTGWKASRETSSAGYRSPAGGGQGAASVRGGVLTQAAMLTVTSNPTRTSPVKRGKWVLENILGTPPPDPPPNVPMLRDDAKAVATGTLRQRMEQHRKDPNCAVCHKEMDALGFALENFDAVGAWRTKDGKFPIDAAAQLPDGRSFNGPRELKAMLRGSTGTVCPLPDGEVADLRRRPRHGTLRQAGGRRNRGCREGRRLQVLDVRPGHRPQRTLPKTHAARIRSERWVRARGFPGGPCCGASARRSRCRGWSRSCPGCRRRPSGGPPRRMAFFSVPNGMHMPDWTPKEEGPLRSCRPSSRRWQPLKSSVTVLTGLTLDGGRPKRDGPGDHARSAASFLTGAHPYKTSGKDIRNGVSVEQAAAEKVGCLTRFASLELGCEHERAGG